MYETILPEYTHQICCFHVQHGMYPVSHVVENCLRARFVKSIEVTEINAIFEHSGPLEC